VKLANVTGAHLTDTDRRNIKALLAHEAFVPGTAFRVGRSKTYTINEIDDDVREVVLVEPAKDDFGRRFDRTYRSTFTITKEKE